MHTKAELPNPKGMSELKGIASQAILIGI